MDKKSPYVLKRIQPRLPQQQLVKKGHESDVEIDVTGYMRQKKVSRFFSDKKHPVDEQLKQLHQSQPNNTSQPSESYRGK